MTWAPASERPVSSSMASSTASSTISTRAPLRLAGRRRGGHGLGDPRRRRLGHGLRARGHGRRRRRAASPPRRPGGSRCWSPPFSSRPVTCSSRVEPKPRRVGGVTVGPPLSVQVSSKPPSARRAQRRFTRPVSTDSAPNFTALAASSCRPSASALAARGRQEQLRPLPAGLAGRQRAQFGGGQVVDGGAAPAGGGEQLVGRAHGLQPAAEVLQERRPARWSAAPSARPATGPWPARSSPGGPARPSGSGAGPPPACAAVMSSTMPVTFSGRPSGAAGHDAGHPHPDRARRRRAGRGGTRTHRRRRPAAGWPLRARKSARSSGWMKGSSAFSALGRHGAGGQAGDRRHARADHEQAADARPIRTRRGPATSSARSSRRCSSLWPRSPNVMRSNIGWRATRSRQEPCGGAWRFARRARQAGALGRLCGQAGNRLG